MSRESLIADEDFPDVAAHPEDAFLDGYEAGAAVAFGLMGMALAIQKNGPKLVERSYWETDDGTKYYDTHCPDCGCYMKNLDAGKDEGTDNEFCGICRYS